MNILVLGGNGYLGNKIVNLLACEGHNVVATIRNAAERNKNLKKGIRFIPASVDAIETVLQYEEMDMVINTVCNYGRSNILYGDVIGANIEFPLKVLDMAAAHGVKKFITIGTGLPDELNMYSFSKKMFSEFGRFYVEKQGIDFITLRLEMFYGADEPDNRFLPSIIRKMIRGEEVNATLGTQRRDIIAVEDIINSVKLVVDNNIKGFSEISVGTGIAPTISEIVDYVWDITGRKSVVNKGAIPMRKNEPDCIADTQEIEKLGEWKPVYWKDGLLSMMNEIKNNMNKEEETR